MIFDKDKGNPTEERHPFQQMVLEKLDIPRRKKLNLNLIAYIKINLKMNFSVQCKTIKLSGKKKKSIGENLQGLEPGREFLDLM